MITSGAAHANTRLSAISAEATKCALLFPLTYPTSPYTRTVPANLSQDRDNSSIGCKISYLCLDHASDSQSLSTAPLRGTHGPGKASCTTARTQDRGKDIVMVRRSQESVSSGPSSSSTSTSSSSSSRSSKRSFLEMVWGRQARTKSRNNSGEATIVEEKVVGDVRSTNSPRKSPILVPRSPVQRPSVRARRRSSQQSRPSTKRKESSGYGSRSRSLSVAVTARGILEASSRDRRITQEGGNPRLRAGPSVRRPSRQGEHREPARGRRTSHAEESRVREREGSYERRRPRDEKEMRVEGMVRGREEVTRAFLDV